MRDTTDVLVIGGGVTGSGIARDLSLRGLEVVLLEKGDFSTGASGRSHGMLHSGARYAVKDPQSAEECAAENEVLKRIAPHCVEETGGLFVALSSDDDEYPDVFKRACKRVEVPARELSPGEALAMEPGLSDDVQEVFEVPDAGIDPFALTLANLDDASSSGAVIRNYARVTDLKVDEGRIEEVRYIDRRNSSTKVVRPEVVVNATGAWADTIAGMAGLEVPVRVDKGTLLVFNGRMVDRLINRLRPPSDGDIVVPNHSTCILGTTCIEVDSPDQCCPTREEIDLLIKEGQQTIPELRQSRIIRSYAGARPLPAAGEDGRSISRGFRIIDHREEGVDNMVSIIGGKLTTYRLMAEELSDHVASRLGNRALCVTSKEEISDTLKLEIEDTLYFPLNRMSKKYSSHNKELSDFLSLPRGREVLCSCEQVLRGEAEYFCHRGGVKELSDLMRRTRAGMGYCQSGACVFELLSVLTDYSDSSVLELYQEYQEERWKGIAPILHLGQLDQEAFKLNLTEGVYSLDSLRREKDEG